MTDLPPSGAIVWFVKPDTAPPLGLLWNGVETLVLRGPTGTHLGGHREKGERYLRHKLEWVRSQGYAPAPPGWPPPRLTRRERRLIQVLREDPAQGPPADPAAGWRGAQGAG